MKEEKKNPPCGNCHKDHEGRTLCRKEDLTPSEKELIKEGLNK